MNFDPFGSFEDLEKAFRRLGEDRREKLRFFVFTGALLAVALILLAMRGFV